MWFLESSLNVIFRDIVEGRHSTDGYILDDPAVFYRRISDYFDRCGDEKQTADYFQLAYNKAFIRRVRAIKDLYYDIAER